MKCLCFSDSHGYTYYIKEALRMHPDCEVVFFLGDGLSDIEALASEDTGRKWLAVRGNCDLRALMCGSEVKKTDSITLMGNRITYTHGDLYGAKYGPDGLLGLAERTESDIILFGHTHKPYEKYFPTDNGGIYLFNPGSIAGSWDSSPTFGVINLTENGVLFSHGSFV